MLHNILSQFGFNREDISLNVKMYVERAEDEMFAYLANEYKDIVASLTRRGCQIAYKTFNKEKRVFIVSWTRVLPQMSLKGQCTLFLDIELG